MRHIVVVQDPVIAPFFRSILPNDALKHFRTLIQKGGCIMPKMSRTAISVACLDFVICTLLPQGDALVYHSQD